MKTILLISFLIGAAEMTAIKPVLWTNAQIPVTQITVDVVNKTEGSVDFAWKLYNDTDSVIDYGVIQIAAITMGPNGGAVPDTDFINYSINPDSFPVIYVMGQKGLIRD